MLKLPIKFFILGMFINALNGCNGYSKEKFKHIIQKDYDNSRIENNIKGNLCYYVGSVKFPFTQERINENDTNWKKSVKRELKRTLPLFTEIGLLKRSPIEGQQDLYYYELTELGQKYQYFYSRYYPFPGNTINENAFCYGIIKVDKVTRINVKDDKLQSYPFKHQVYVDYDYHVENVPEWVVLNQDKLNHRYEWVVRIEGKIYKDTLLYQAKEDGYLHVLSGGKKMIDIRVLEDDE